MNPLNLLKPSRWVARWHHNWLNPFATLFFNFHYLPFAQAVKLPVWLYGHPHLMALKGAVEITSSSINCGMIRLNKSAHTPYPPMPFDFINDGGTLRFAGKAQVDNGSRFHLFGGGVLELGCDVRIISSILGCQEHITIGDRTWVTNHSTILDSDFHLLRNHETGEVKCHFAPVHIGSDVMIYAHSFVSKGCTIANHCVVSSYTHLKRPIQDMQPYSLIAGDPAQVVKVGYEFLNLPGAEEARISQEFKAGAKSVFIQCSTSSIS